MGTGRALAGVLEGRKGGRRSKGVGVMDNWDSLQGGPHYGGECRSRM